MTGRVCGAMGLNVSAELYSKNGRKASPVCKNRWLASCGMESLGVNHSTEPGGCCGPEITDPLGSSATNAALVHNLREYFAYNEDDDGP